MEAISTVTQSLSPIVSRSESAASARVAESFGNEVDTLLAAVSTNSTLGTQVDVKV
jgi:hypothetical protein